MKRLLDPLRDDAFDLLVLGGGITGAGVALDASLRGLRVALIDKQDFASGTSSVSSKLVHGGLRYLEHGDFRLVREALQERRLLVQNAPHLVHELRFLIPWHRGSRISPWQWRLALTAYDLLAGRANLRRSRPLRRSALTRDHPELLPEGLLGGALYSDAQMDDARVCLEVLRSAAASGAVVANYVEALAFEKRGEELAGARVLDRIGGKELVIRARQVLNATGPWVDAVCRLAGDAAGPYLRPTKGAHLVTPDRGLRTALLLLHPRDGRVFFVIPWLGKTLVGTTDTFTPEGPDALAVTPEEVAYLLEGHNRFLRPPLAEGDVLGTFVGLRPLIRSRPNEPSAISREFKVLTSPSGLISVAGGKFTTYRSMAEQVVDVVVRRRQRGRTRDFPLDGAPRESWPEFASRTIARLTLAGLSEGTARHLVRRYGRRAPEVVRYLTADRRLAEPIVPGEPDIRAELAYQKDEEMAQFPEDHYLRRTRLGLFHPGLLKQRPFDQRLACQALPP